MEESNNSEARSQKKKKFFREGWSRHMNKAHSKKLAVFMLSDGVGIDTFVL
jgi:hypothetical protein